MICITVTESDGEYISVESNGHADYAEKGQDIICAAVSALIVNTVNSVETLTEDLIISEAGDGYVYFSFPNGYSESTRKYPPRLWSTILRDRIQGGVIPC